MNQPAKHRCAAMYEFRVRGLLPEGWADWFEGFKSVSVAGGDSLLIGPVPDQAALHGVLVKIRDFNLVLLSVNVVGEGGNIEFGA